MALNFFAYSILLVQLLHTRCQVWQGFQLLGIAWREKHRARSARTHKWDLDRPYVGPGAKPLTWVQGSAPLCKKICISWGNLHNFKPFSSLNLLLHTRCQVWQGFQLLGIAWREKHRARNARTHKWDLDRSYRALCGSRGKALDMGPRQRPLVQENLYFVRKLA